MEKRERNVGIVQKRIDGLTLQEIGDEYGITRERVRQIVFQKMAPKRKVRIDSSEKERKDKERKSREKWGLSVRDKDRIAGFTITPGSPSNVYCQQRTSAKYRGIYWNFTFAGWWYLWCLSGKYLDRGIGSGKYVMARYGDRGPYSLGNCKIILASDNLSEWYSNKLKSPVTCPNCGHCFSRS